MGVETPLVQSAWKLGKFCCVKRTNGFALALVSRSEVGPHERKTLWGGLIQLSAENLWGTGGHLFR